MVLEGGKKNKRKNNFNEDAISVAPYSHDSVETIIPFNDVDLIGQNTTDTNIIDDLPNQGIVSEILSNVCYHFNYQSKYRGTL